MAQKTQIREMIKLADLAEMVTWLNGQFDQKDQNGQKS